MNTLEFIGITALIIAFACLLGTMAMINTAMAIHLKMMMPRRNGRPKMENPIPPPPRKKTTIEFNLDVSPAIAALNRLESLMDKIKENAGFRLIDQLDFLNAIKEMDRHLVPTDDHWNVIYSVFKGQRPSMTGIYFTPEIAELLRIYLYTTGDQEYFQNTIQSRIKKPFVPSKCDEAC